MRKISIVIPLHNEKESLPLLAKSIVEVLEAQEFSYEVIFVDDGSTDGSFDTLKELRETYGNKFKLYRFCRNYGKSAALSVGIKKASGDVIITMDADLQDDPSAIPDMVKKLDEGWDLVSGWKKKRYDPVTFTLPSKLWNIATSMLTGIRLHDFNCGFKAYRAETAKSLDIYGDRHRYLPALAHWDGFKITEIPVPHHARQFGKSNYGFGKFFTGMMDMLTLLFLRKYLKNPLHFFGFLGFFLIAIGGVVLGYFGVLWAITGEMHVRPIILLSMGAVIMGIQFLSFGFLAEMLVNAGPKDTYTIRDEIE